ncbi:MAG: hypothetical protein P1U53_16785 [Sulfitobacter sp.]|uniref:hypothetical protein n=1 Tax=Antarcticimicrobium sp. TaxID=2824147 RepID=UPI00262F0E9F|nr:hypothetical protein [Antarcticimicrobium sp.]MDF1715954.1 hypothetical protein [Antarcticimicrobium sp.]MDF1729399.1 hypothetical protein [Sulfitobacter sp.]
MILAGILRTLRTLPEDQCAETAARIGFLNWLMSLPAGCGAGAAARAAERRAAPMARGCPAVARFCAHLRAARRADRDAAWPKRRGGSRARRAERRGRV